MTSFFRCFCSVYTIRTEKILKLFNQEDFICMNILEMVFHHSPIPEIVDTKVRALLLHFKLATSQGAGNSLAVHHVQYIDSP